MTEKGAIEAATGGGRADGSESRLAILIVGVGGQGVLTAGGFLGQAALSKGLNVNVGQLHGMSQRGGSVEGTVLIGPGKGAFIEPGGAAIVLGFEPFEALRALPKLSPKTMVLLNTGRITPRALVLEGNPYPDLEEILGHIRRVTSDVRLIDGPSILAKVGEPRTISTVMLGYLAGMEVLPFDAETLWRAIEARCPPRYLEVNRQAFSLGRGAVGQRK